MSKAQLKELLRSAKAAVEAQEFGSVLQLCKKAMKISKNNYHVLVMAGIAQKGLGELEKAEQVYRMAIAEKPDQVAAWQGLVEVYDAGHAPHEAPAAYERIIELTAGKENHAAKWKGAVEKLAAWCVGEGADARALPWLRELVAVDAAAVQPRVDLVRVLYRMHVASLRTLSDDARREASDAHVREAGELDDLLAFLVQQGAACPADCAAMHVARRTRRIALAADWQAQYMAWLEECLGMLGALPHAFAAAELLLVARDNDLCAVPDDMAAHIVHRLCHSFPARGSGWVGLGVQMVERGDVNARTARVLEHGLESAPQFARGWWALATCAAAEHQYESAVRHAERGLDAAAEQQRTGGVSTVVMQRKLLALVGEVHVRAGVYDKAGAVYTRMMALPGGEPVDAWEGIARMHFVQEHHADALAHFDKVLGADATRAAVRSDAAWCQFKLGRADDALASLKQACSAGTLKGADEAALWLRMGLVQWQLGGEHRSKSGAHASFLRAAKCNATNATPFLYLGHWYRDAGAATHAKAAKCYERAVTLEPTLKEAGVALADLYADMGKLASVTELCERVTASNPRALWAWRRMAFSLADKDQHEDAVRAFQQVVRLDDSDMSVWEGLADAYLHQGKFMAAMRAYGKIREVCGDDTSAYVQYQIAHVHHKLGLHEEALEHFQALLAVHTEFVLGWKGYGEACIHFSHQLHADGSVKHAGHALRRAVSALETCIKLDASLHCVWKLLGDAHTAFWPLSGEACASRAYALTIPRASGEAYSQEKGEGAEALNKHLSHGHAAYLHAADLEPESAFGRYDLGVNTLYRANAAAAAGRAGDAETLRAEAATHFKDALHRRPHEAHMWNALGVAESHPSVRQHCFIRAVQLREQYAVAWNNLGMLYLEHGRIALARQAFARGQTHDYTESRSWIGMARINEQAGALDKAREFFAHAVSLEPQRQDARLGHAWSAFQCGRWWEARHAAVKYLEKAPMDAEAFNLLALALEQLGLWDEAKRACTIALHILSTEGAQRGDTAAAVRAVHSNRARIRVMLGEYTDAFADYRAADMEAMDTWVGVAFMYYRTDQLNEAVQAFQKALELGKAHAAGAQWERHIYTALAIVSMRVQKLDAAQKCALHVVESAPEWRTGWETLFVVGVVASDPRLAYRAIKELMAMSERATVHRVNAMIALLCAQQGKVALGKRYMLKGIHDTPFSAERWNDLGDYCVSLCNEYAAVRAWLRQMGARGLLHSDVHAAADMARLCGLAALTVGADDGDVSGVADRAVRELVHALHVEPARLDVHYALAFALLHAGHVNGRAGGVKLATARFESLIRLLHMHASDSARDVRLSAAARTRMLQQAQLGLAEALTLADASKSNVEKAIAVAKHALEQHGGTDAVFASMCYRQLSRGALALGRLDQGLQLHMHALKTQPGSLLLWQELAEVLLRCGRPVAAVRCMESCVARAEDKTLKVRLLGRLACMLRNAQRPDESAKFVRQILRTDKKNCVALALQALQ